MNLKKNYFIIYLLLFISFSISCDKKEDKTITAPVVGTAPFINELTHSSFKVGAEVTDDGGAEVTERGMCYDVNPKPLYGTNNVPDGSGIGPFITLISGLQPNTTYYVRPYAKNSAGISYGVDLKVTTKNPPFTLGQEHGGGYIFYIDDSGLHGLIAAPNDYYSGAQWGCYGTSIPGLSTALGSGQANTNAMISNCNAAVTAATLCDNYVANTFSDWYLPSKDELDLMYWNLYKSNIGNFGSLGSKVYWSSSESGSNSAWSMNFFNGEKNETSKSFGYTVRPVRSF